MPRGKGSRIRGEPGRAPTTPSPGDSVGVSVAVCATEVCPFLEASEWISFFLMPEGAFAHTGARFSWTRARLCSAQRLGKSRSAPGTELASHEEVVNAVTPVPISAAAAAISPHPTPPLSCC